MKWPHNLRKLRDAGLKLKPRECLLFAKEVEYLGHIISSYGIKTDPNKTKVIQEWPKSGNVHEVRSFLGFCSYYRRFIAKFAEAAKKLRRLSEKGQKFIWTDDCEKAFEILKNKMVESPVLAHSHLYLTQTPVRCPFVENKWTGACNSVCQ